MDLAYENREFERVTELQNFPNGSCGITSCLLGEYLMENGIPNKYINRTYYYSDTSFDSQAHTWLELTPNLIVDITGDQFKNNCILCNYSVAVYVGPYNDFYNLFEKTPNGEYEFKKDKILSPYEKDIYYEKNTYNVNVVLPKNWQMHNFMLCTCFFVVIAFSLPIKTPKALTYKALSDGAGKGT